jgi:glycerate 2-kinase
MVASEIEPHSILRSPWRDAIRAVQNAALLAVEPAAAVRRHVACLGGSLIVDGKGYDLAEVEHVWVVGAGKASPGMSAALLDILGSRITSGMVITKYGHTTTNLDPRPVEIVEAGHPLPDEAGMDAARRMMSLLDEVTERDLVLAVLSGGGSALLTLPASDLTLADLQETTDLLLRSGATIVELNAVRKHLSSIKGGGLARSASPAQLIGLILSDVVGDPLDVIASGPTAPDPTTFRDAWMVLEQYRLVEQVPVAVRVHLEAGVDGTLCDTPKPGDPLFTRVQNVVIGSNRLAAETAVQEAGRQGLNALLLSTFVEGEARQVGLVAAALAKELVCHDRPVPRPACLVWGGETTVTLRGHGRGGRNQELALAAVVSIAGLPNVLLVCFGTDGTDGPTDAAGAVATGETLERAKALGLDPFAHLSDNDAYPFFGALGDLIRTGPTGTNVNDLGFIYAFR